MVMAMPPSDPTVPEKRQLSVLTSALDNVDLNEVKLPVTTHISEAAPRPDRLGIERLTHAPLNFRVFPEMPLSIDQFEFETGSKSSLGKGAMGNVQLARWITRPGKPLRAIKKINKFQMWKDDDPIMLFEQLWDEIEALMTLKHDNIVGLDGYFEDYKYVYLIMEYAPHGDLNQILSETERFTEEDTIRHVRSLVKALLFCHSHKYLHRDIKPENLLLSSKGELLLADFGCVATVHSSKKSLCGTRHYHSYEIANNESHDEASDAWSVGVVAYELLHGRGPFESDNEDDETDMEFEEDDEDEGGSGAEETEEESVDDEEEVSDEEDNRSDGNPARDDNETDTDDDFQDAHETASEVRAGTHTRFNQDDNLESELNQEDHTSDEEVEDEGEPEEEEEDEEEEEVEDENEEEEEDEDNDDGEDSDGDAGSQTSEAASEDSAEIKAIYSRIVNMDYTFPGYFSDDAIDFISRLLVQDKTKRMTLSEALEHPFLAESSDNS